MWENVREFVNLTPHDVRIMIGDNLRVLPKSGKIARVKRLERYGGFVDGIPVVICTDVDTIDVPAPEEGVIYIVSSMVADVLKRPDMLSPDTSPEGSIRDGKGVVKAVTQLKCFVEEKCLTETTKS